ncbi:MAG: adenylyltransferase/cytidyltransferase family protein [bacterium]
MQYKIALFIGRFQPFHNGHLYSLKKCFDVADAVIVGIGSSNIRGTLDNPWDFETRKRMIGAVSQEVNIIAIPDTPSDEEWVKEVIHLVPKFDVVVSNNNWVTNLMKHVGYPISKTGLFNRDELEGVKIRELMRRGDVSWKSRVPEEVASQIDVFPI